MKLFSRKSLVAAATSAALVSGVLVSPATADTVEETSSSSSAPTSTTVENDEPGEVQDTETDEPSETETQEPEPEESSSDGFLAGSSDDEGDIDPGQIRDWVAVFTAIIGALSTVFVFAERNLD